jgi:hypothetical protein
MSPSSNQISLGFCVVFLLVTKTVLDGTGEPYSADKVLKQIGRVLLIGHLKKHKRQQMRGIEKSDSTIK